MIELETERLLLRAPSPRDAADLYEYAQTGFVGPMAGWRPHVSLRESRRILKRYRECGYIYAVCSKADGGKMIGTAGCTRTKNALKSARGCWATRFTTRSGAGLRDRSRAPYDPARV